MKMMETIFTSLEQLKETSGRKMKLELLKKLVKADHEDVFRQMLVYTYHPYWNYWMKWDPDQYAKYKKVIASDRVWLEFKSLLDQLKERKVTGNSARQKVKDFFARRCTMRERYWFSQILNRRIEIGLLLRSFSKMYTDLVPECSFMLAEKWEGNDLKGEWVIQPKIDGERAAVIFDEKGVGTIISRSGRPKTNCEHIVEEMRSVAKSIGYSVMFDGELAGESWGDVGASRGKKKSKKKLHFYVFDHMPLKNWEAKKNVVTEKLMKYSMYQSRLDSLEELFDGRDLDHIHLLDSTFLKNPTAKQLLALKARMIKDGQEGWVAKRAMSLYLFKRDEDWLKAKFRETFDLKVDGATEGGGKYRGIGIGALICTGWIGKGKKRVKIITKVGQGFSDKQRKRFYQLWKANKLKGLVVEIDHYGMTDALRVAKKHSGLPVAVRNGIFKRLRKDKTER